MDLAKSFHRSFYLTLALALVCLGFADHFFLPKLWIFIVAILGLLFWSYRHEGRWAMNDVQTNRAGLVIACGMLLWILWRTPRNEDDLAALGVPWPAGVLPILGPLPALLIAVKCFRPKKLDDFWSFQILALTTVTLSCVLTGDPWFFWMLFAYLCSFVWCLTLFEPYRRQRLLQAASRQDSREPTGGRPPLDMFVPQVPSGSNLYWGKSLATTLLLLMGAMAIFLLAPRFSNEQWTPQRLSGTGPLMLRSGNDSGIDLTSVGKIELSREPAFEVRAFAPPGVDPSLPIEQRWRLQVLDVYDRGRWHPWRQSPGYPLEQPAEFLPFAAPGETVPDPSDPPTDLKPNQRYLAFQVRLSRAGGLVLADPIDKSLGVGLRGYFNDQPAYKAFFEVVPGADAIATASVARKVNHHYGQVLQENPIVDRHRAGPIVDPYRELLLDTVIPSEVSKFTKNLLLDLPGLTDADVATDVRGRILPENQARLARAISRYFALTGEYTYTLRLSRKNPRLDPTVDFLLNVKEGHCERFAAALALVLRGLGMPARIVKGYRGYEVQGDGSLLVRQSMAHSWVEVLVPSEQPGQEDWLMLDPTPGEEVQGRSMLAWLDRLWNHARHADVFWKNFVVEYSGDTQVDTIQTVWRSLTETRRLRAFWSDVWDVVQGVGATLLIVALGWFGWRSWRNMPAPSPYTTPRPRFYERFLQHLDRRHGLKPLPGQTPREFADMASQKLASPTPTVIADALYEMQYAGKSFCADELRRLEKLATELN